jgi:hypothetical protein
MTIKKIITALALTAGVASGASLALASGALAQSAYTSGTVASSEAAGYPSAGDPNGGASGAGYGRGYYAYAPGYAADGSVQPQPHHVRGNSQR